MKPTLLLVSVAIALAVGTSLAKPPSEKSIPFLEAKKFAINNPRVEYPPEALKMRATGSAVVLLRVDSAGTVTSATMAKSTGTPILDRAALSTGRLWRFKPGQ